MRISDVVGGADLSIFAQLALPFALAAFGMVLVYVFVPRKDPGVWSRRSRIPLDDGEICQAEGPEKQRQAVDAPTATQQRPGGTPS